MRRNSLLFTNRLFETLCIENGIKCLTFIFHSFKTNLLSKLQIVKHSGFRNAEELTDVNRLLDNDGVVK